MLEHDRRSMRVLVDLQACQTAGSAQRGVGRYSQALFSAIAKSAPPRSIHAVGAAHHPFPLTLDRFPANRLCTLGSMPNWNTPRDFNGGEQDALDAGVLSAAIGGANPDLIHISHIFEGYSDRVALPSLIDRPLGQVLSATLYDLIPLRFSDHYFQDARFKRWYLHRLKWLRQADLLLAISESSRQDAISLLGIDPSRIVTILGGVSAHFKPVANPAAARERLRARYGIDRQKFILYTGGDDHRKNIQGAIDGYASLPADTRQTTQLVIVCAMEPHRILNYTNLARKSGIDKNDLLFIGFVPEDDLVELYSTCDVFVFPSLYEGLGLPIIEAQSCGAAVIAGNNSSLIEFVREPQALFNSSKADSIAECMQRVLTNEPLKDHLRHVGLAQASHLTWDRTAKTALNAFDEAVRLKRESGVRAAQSGWLKRQRLAMFTPLPPCRSGIADYNAQFLPFLAEYFDIDIYTDGYNISDESLNASFRVYDVNAFRASANAYDAIVYEFGNSEFHVHMLPLLSEFPGVVGLHDAFLSGMMGYLEFNLGEKNRYAHEMLGAHAGQARRLFAPVVAHPDAIGTSMVHLPCTKRVLDQATGVISHSKFNLAVARDFYPEGWAAPYRIIPQMVVTAEPWSKQQVASARADLGYQPDDFVVTTFGHIAWTKCGDRLLEAFLASALRIDARCHLVFAGELAKDDFGLTLNDRIKKCGLGKRVKITGFLSEVDYARFLRITDVAVQLRTKSRGGTPKGVLDCLAHGVPVIVNNEASYEDYPDDVVIKLNREPQIIEISEALVELQNQSERRNGFIERGLVYVRENHDPRLCAAQYAAAIAEFGSRYAATNVANHASALAPHLAGCAQPMQAAAQAAAFLDAVPRASFERPRLIIDVSHIAKNDHGTGIPRVMRETVRAAYCSPSPGFDAVAVELVGETLVKAWSWLDQQGLLLPFELNDPRAKPIDFRPGDHLLMLDSSWARYAEFTPVFARARAAGVPITTAVYDLLPLTLPPGNIVPGGKEWFEGWIRSAVEESDSLVCISRAVADDLIAHITANKLGKPGLKVGYWHLGANLPVKVECAASSPVRQVVGSYALMVGTLEPRKNHALAIDAFERLWQHGTDLSLVIAGRPGWMVDDLLQRIGCHKLRDKKLFFFENLVDADVQYLYRNATALLFPSKGEGFGLPLVEAAQHGTPIICADIPAFREISGTHATYVRIENADQLASGISDWCSRLGRGESMGSGDMPWLNWGQSTEALIDVVVGQKWYAQI
jgi:glycosyltransferase involved in cell wall biosynthesis